MRPSLILPLEPKAKERALVKVINALMRLKSPPRVMKDTRGSEWPGDSEPVTHRGPDLGSSGICSGTLTCKKRYTFLNQIKCGSAFSHLIDRTANVSILGSCFSALGIPKSPGGGVQLESASHNSEG